MSTQDDGIDTTGYGTGIPAGTWGGDGGGWLSGLGDLFSTVGSTFSSVYRSVNTPTQPSTTVRWGTGGTLASGGGTNVLVLAALAIGAILLLRK